MPKGGVGDQLIKPSPQHDRLAELIAEAWPRAREHWSRFMLLSAPVDDSNQPSVAQIHLGTRQIALNYDTLVEKNLFDCVEGVLAHEIGHHVRYPGTLAVEARLRLLERSLLPLKDYSVVNMFEDLMINERLGRSLKDQLIRVYQAFTDEPAFHRDGRWRLDPAFFFYLAIYEELWRLKPGAIMGRTLAAYDKEFPGYRAEAQVLAQNLFNVGPNLYTQFVYFLSVLTRYITPLEGDMPQKADPHACGKGEPSAEDWAAALTPNEREQEALHRALEEGWITAVQAERLKEDPVQSRIVGLPGIDTADQSLIPEVMAAYYRQQAEKYLFRPPRQRTMGEAIVPTTLEDWEVGDSVRDIDWLTTLSQRGVEYGSAAPMRRSPVAEYEGHDVAWWRPRMEIYLDVSGSMPDPRFQRNAMTLAAQILAMASIRAGGSVRAALYSGDAVTYWQWCRSEVEMSKFLMHYMGGGTEFPFSLLRESVESCHRDQPIRVIISDPDFDGNYDKHKSHADIFSDAARHSHQMILLLHFAQQEAIGRYREAGASVIEIPDMEAFPKMAADLSLNLFPRGADAID